MKHVQAFAFQRLSLQKHKILFMDLASSANIFVHLKYVSLF